MTSLGKCQKLLILSLSGIAFGSAFASPAENGDPLADMIAAAEVQVQTPAAPRPQTASPSPFGLRIANTARSQTGTPYRLGQHAPGSGFDCSGLVWWVYKQHGINLPRITTEQAKVGEAISLRDAKAGDIIVFKTNRGATGLHTGILTGRSTFIHAPRTGKNVMESNLSGYWSQRILTVRHVPGLKLPTEFPSADEISLALANMPPESDIPESASDPLFTALQNRDPDLPPLRLNAMEEHKNPAAVRTIIRSERRPSAATQKKSGVKTASAKVPAKKTAAKNSAASKSVKTVKNAAKPASGTAAKKVSASKPAAQKKAAAPAKSAKKH